MQAIIFSAEEGFGIQVANMYSHREVHFPNSVMDAQGEGITIRIMREERIAID